MNHRSFTFRILWLVCAAAAAAFLSGCDGGSQKTARPPKKPKRQPVAPVVVEQRADGLFYLPGATEPFTGDAITPNPNALWQVQKREPFLNGKRHGDVLTYYHSGAVKSLRRYEHGVPKYAAAFYKNGQKKFELPLNENDKGEGPYRRWHENGRLHAEATFDSEERWHSDFKEWNDKGELTGHRVFEHGKLVKIIFENEEGKAEREKAGVPAPPETPEQQAAEAEN